jgi:hypothetical protein
MHYSKFSWRWKIQVDFFLVVTSCSVVVGHQHFRGSCCLHLQNEVKMEAEWTSKTVQSYHNTTRRASRSRRNPWSFFNSPTSMTKCQNLSILSFCKYIRLLYILIILIDSHTMLIQNRLIFESLLWIPTTDDPSFLRYEVWHQPR